MKSKKELCEEAVSRCKSILDAANGESLNAEQQAQFDFNYAIAENLKAEAGLGRQVPASVPAPNTPQANAMKCDTIQASAPNTPIRFFKGTDAAEKAYGFGMFCLGLAGNKTAQNWCGQKGFFSSYQTEGANGYGGYLVPGPLSRDIIDLRNQYGVFRRNAKLVAMTSDTLSIPRRTGGLTSYYPGEAGTITSSVKTWDLVKLSTKKLAVLTAFSNELNQDAIAPLGDDLANEISWQFAFDEDSAGFNGDGTSTYGGIFGVVEKLSALNGVDDGGGLVLATGNAYSEIVIGDFLAMLGRIPAYALPGAKWYCSNSFFASVMLKIAYAGGGVTGAELLSGSMARQFLSYPVELSEVMPTSEGNSQICCLFGDLSKAASFGDRTNGVVIDYSNSATINGKNLFESDMGAIRGVERFDINVHDVGTASAAGPVVGLITKAN